MDGRLMMGGEQLSEALDALVMFLNHRVVTGRPDLLSLHSSAVCIEGGAVLAPAASGSGKSTLCASLLQLGCDYLSDESIGVTVDGTLLGYAKPIGLKLGSRRLLDRPELAYFDLDAGRQWVWQIPASLFGGGVAPSARPQLIVVPQFVEGAAVRISELAPHLAAHALLEQVQNLYAFGMGPALEVLGRVVSHVKCFRVTFGDARDAAQEILELLSARRGDKLDLPFRVWTPDEIPLRRRRHPPTPAADLHALLFTDGGVLVRGGDGAMAALDAVGVSLLSAFADDGLTVAALIDDVAGRIETARATVETDVHGWLSSLSASGFFS